MVVKTRMRKCAPLIISADLNSRVDREVFIYVEKNEAGFMNYLACEDFKELYEYMIEFGFGTKGKKADDSIIICGVVCDASNLPFDVPEKKELYVFFNDTEIYRYANMELATTKIESLVASAGFDLCDIVVVIGKQVQMIIRNSMLAKVQLAQSIMEK